ncbi:hypothetical protein AGDE_04157 [Angomonas deanei]|uniref:Uncharacterized protein n=1 Tax=Angomonas deanei TaxID=59799 RepID=A0A7G2C7I6_9TRYP|nr:hypothetical protein AGDE_04157 [Angomonas deanei]CAD2215716.1 hypothetical protein, conserved [Angomonas deanei]|eukprot:EPY39771.1 hypothetical protein AGDE_04157 [Angomonas deanei]
MFVLMRCFHLYEYIFSFLSHLYSFLLATTITISIIIIFFIKKKMSDDPAINSYLLNMCAKAQPEGAAGSSITPEGRRPEDYEWLREAMQSVESPERKVKRLLKTIEAIHFEKGDENVILLEKGGNPNKENKQEGETRVITEDDVLLALEELSDMVEDINWASEFDLMDGPQRVLNLLKPLVEPSHSEGGEEYFYAADTEALYFLCMLIAHSAQLNEKLQATYHRLQWTDVLVPLLAPDRCLPPQEKENKKKTSSFATSWPVVAALLHACSCLCRDCPANALLWVERGGFATMVSLCVTLRERFFSESSTFANLREKTQVVKIIKRIFFLVAYLAEEGISSEVLLHAVVDITGGASAALQRPSSSSSEEEEEEKEDLDRLVVDVEQSGSRTLVVLYQKSPTLILQLIKENTALSTTMRGWRQTLQREEIVSNNNNDNEGSSDDPRLSLIEVLEKNN